MKWFDRWFAKQAKKAWEAAQADRHNMVYTSDKPPRLAPSQDLDTTSAANIRIHAAHGGKVIEISNWDSRHDCHNRELYIVRDDAELGPELTSIIMQHSLRH